MNNRNAHEFFKPCASFSTIVLTFGIKRNSFLQLSITKSPELPGLKPMNKPLCILLVAATSLFVCRQAAAQNTMGRWSLGVRGGSNIWLNDYDTKKYGVGGDVLLKYGISPYFSMGLLTGFEVLKTQQPPATANLNFFYLRMQTIPASLIAMVHLFPKKLFTSYIYAGGGPMFYRRAVDNNIPHPDNMFRSSYVAMGGIGLEYFFRPGTSIGLDAGYRNIDKEKLDDVLSSTVRGFVTVKLGMNFYLGSSDDDDDDNDGLTNAEERRYGTDPENPDTDGDGLSDGDEVKKYHTNPLKVDTDGDGLSDGDEVFKYHTDPTKFDTDGDGLSDGDEVLKYHTDPLKMDTDGDGLTDGEEVLVYHTNPLKVDSDGDGLSDWDEVKTYHTDPNNPDTDGDGLSDGDEVKKYHTDPLNRDTDGGGVDDGTEVKRGTNPLDPSDDFPVAPLKLEKGKAVVLDGVNFVSGSANLTPASETTLDRAYTALVEHTDLKIEIAGYSDNIGRPLVNQKLSQRRAEAVRAWLVKKGIAASRITAIGRGDKDPIASNATADGRAKNRRIEFHVH